MDTEAKSYQSEGEEKCETEVPEKREISLHKRYLKRILVLLLHEIQLNAPPFVSKRNPVFSTNILILN